MVGITWKHMVWCDVVWCGVVWCVCMSTHVCVCAIACVRMCNSTEQLEGEGGIIE